MFQKILKLCLMAFLCIAISNPMAVKAASVEANSTDACIDEKNCPAKEDVEKKMQEMKDRWTALTDKQKEDIYKAMKNSINAEAKYIDKLAKYGVFTEEDATSMKEDMFKRYEDMKEKGELFMGKASNTNTEKQNQPRPQENGAKNTTPTMTPTKGPDNAR